MNIAVKGNQVKENKALEDYAFKKAQKFYHYHNQITKVEVELRTEKGRKERDGKFIADINVHVPGKTERITDQENDLYKAIDKAVNRMVEILRRQKGKQQGRFRKQIGKLVKQSLGYVPGVLGVVNKRIFRNR